MTSIFYYINISYNGSKFLGYGIQPHKNTVQNILEDSLKKLNGNRVVHTFASSRTDSGVHARDQYLQFKLQVNYLPNELKYKLNMILPKSIYVKKCDYLPDDFNVRYDVEKKVYEYLIINIKNPFLENLLYYNSQDLDYQKMHRVAQVFIGKHNFTGFSSAKANVTDKVRIIYKIGFKKDVAYNQNVWKFYIEGNGFLYNMVRMIVGTLIKIGMNVIKEDDIINVLNTYEKKNIVWTAPAEGLYLTKIKFKKELEYNENNTCNK